MNKKIDMSILEDYLDKLEEKLLIEAKWRNSRDYT